MLPDATSAIVIVSKPMCRVCTVFFRHYTVSIQLFHRFESTNSRLCIERHKRECRVENVAHETVQRFSSMNLVVPILVLHANSVKYARTCVYLPIEAWRNDIVYNTFTYKQNSVRNRANFCTLITCKARVGTIK
jgi:hypothetical protein